MTPLDRMASLNFRRWVTQSALHGTVEGWLSVRGRHSDSFILDRIAEAQQRAAAILEDLMAEEREHAPAIVTDMLAASLKAEAPDNVVRLRTKELQR